jgi:hypothetical protein
MKSVFRLFAVGSTYCSVAIGALTPVNNARLFGPGPRWAKRSEVSAPFQKSNGNPIAMPFEQNSFLGPNQRDGQPDFSASPGEMHWNQWLRQDSHSVAAT